MLMPGTLNLTITILEVIYVQQHSKLAHKQAEKLDQLPHLLHIYKL